MGRLRGLAVACWTTDHYHPCSNPGVAISEGCFVFHFVGGRSAHLAYLVNKSGRKTSIIIIIIIIISTNEQRSYCKGFYLSAEFLKRMRLLISPLRERVSVGQRRVHTTWEFFSPVGGRE